MKTKNIGYWIIAALALLLIILAGPLSAAVLADSTGAHNAGVGTNVGGIGSAAWSNPGDITTPGSPYASVHLSVGFSYSNYLQGTQYGFAIPAESVINGITVVINRRTDKDTPVITDNEVRLIKGGVIVGDNYASGSAWPATFGTVSYGGISNLWGTTWTPSEINNPDFGAALAVVRQTGGSNTAIVDYIQITVEYTISASTTTVNCGSGYPIVIYGDSITCEATVRRLTGSNTPSGTVSWDTNGNGSFTTNPCTLIGSDGVSTCSVSYTPNTVGTITHLISATYSGDSNFTTSVGSQPVTVNRAYPSATLAVISSPVIYNGSPQAVTVSVIASSVPGTVNNILYNGSATTPTNAGTYPITADFVPTDTANYNSLSGLNAGDFVIQKATPTSVILAVTNSPVTYNGFAQPATVALISTSVPGSVSNILYNGSTTVPTNAGTYTVTADFVPTDTTNYSTLYNLAAGNFVIERAIPNATLVVTNSPVTYTGTAQSVEITIVNSSVAGTVSNILYNNSAIVPINAGTYAITADFIPIDTLNYNSLSGLAVGDFIIQKATPTAVSLAVTNSPVTYNSTAQPAIVVVLYSSVPGTSSNILYNGVAVAPTYAGTYAVSADFEPADTVNYNTLPALSAGDFVIQKAIPAATLAVINSPVYYSGSPLAALVSVINSSVPGSVANILYNGLATEPTDVGTYVVTADFIPEDTVNYQPLAGLVAGNFNIRYYVILVPIINK